MRHVVFVAPFFAETTVKFVKATAGLPGAAVSLISQDPVAKLPDDVRQPLVAHRQIADGFDPQQIADAVRDLGREIGPVDRLMGAMEELQIPLAEVRVALRISGIDSDTIQNFRDKARMKSILAKAGVPCAHHALVNTSAELAAFVDKVGLPVIVKPPDGAGARNTHRLVDRKDLDRYLASSAVEKQRPVLAEEFLVGNEHSIETISIEGKPVWHSINHYYPSPLEVIENEWIQWCVVLPREVDDPQYDDIRREARRALDALGMSTGLSHTEWFRRKDGSIAISEVGARPPGAQFTSLISWAHRMDLYQAWARLMVFGQFDPPQRHFAAGAAYLRGQGQGRVRAIHGLEQAQEEIGGLVVEARLPKPGQPAGKTYEGDGYVLLRHPQTDVVKKALKRLITLVRIELG